MVLYVEAKQKLSLEEYSIEYHQYAGMNIKNPAFTLHSKHLRLFEVVVSGTEAKKS